MTGGSDPTNLHDRRRLLGGPFAEQVPDQQDQNGGGYTSGNQLVLRLGFCLSGLFVNLALDATELGFEITRGDVLFCRFRHSLQTFRNSATEDTGHSQYGDADDEIRQHRPVAIEEVDGL